MPWYVKCIIAHLSVETPSGLASAKPPFNLELEEGNVAEILALKDDDNAILALAAYAFRLPIRGNSGRGMFCVVLQPTARLQPTSDPTAESGVWTIRVHNQDRLDAGQDIHAWIQRDDTPFGYPIRGRQSYFDHQDYQRFSERTTPIGSVIDEDSHAEQSADCLIKRAGLINAIATGRETIVVGGYVKERKVRGDGLTVGIEAELADYSAAGPTENSSRLGPDISAISDDSHVHIGVMASGTRSNSKIALNGTSVAAPKIARLIADHVSSSSVLPARPPATPNVCNLEPLVTLTPPHPQARAGCGGVQDEKIEGLPVNRRERFKRDVI